MNWIEALAWIVLGCFASVGVVVSLIVGFALYAKYHEMWQYRKRSYWR